VLDVLGRLRQQDRLDWSMVLDLTRELDRWRVFTSAREARARMRRTYDEDRWPGQPYFPILLVEKDTIEPIARPIASRWQMPFASSRGYGSLTLQHDVAELLVRRRVKTGQTGLIYFISDLDPSGLDLQRAWEEALESFGVYPAFHRVALTPAQVDALPNGQELGIDVKPSDSRTKRYVELYGTKCWEAHPQTPVPSTPWRRCCGSSRPSRRFAHTTGSRRRSGCCGSPITRRPARPGRRG
jgi:hypothetical protein